MFGDIMSTVKEFWLGTLGAVVLDPFVDKGVGLLPLTDPRLHLGVKAIAYPLIAGLGNRFFPSRHWKSLGAVGFVISAAQLFKSFLPSALGGTGYLAQYGVGYLSPPGGGDMSGMGYLAPGARTTWDGFGAMAPDGRVDLADTAT